MSNDAETSFTGTGEQYGSLLDEKNLPKEGDVMINPPETPKERILNIIHAAHLGIDALFDPAKSEKAYAINQRLFALIRQANERLQDEHPEIDFTAPGTLYGINKFNLPLLKRDPTFDYIWTQYIMGQKEIDLKGETRKAENVVPASGLPNGCIPMAVLTTMMLCCVMTLPAINYDWNLQDRDSDSDADTREVQERFFEIDDNILGNSDAFLSWFFQSMNELKDMPIEDMDYLDRNGNFDIPNLEDGESGDIETQDPEPVVISPTPVLTQGDINEGTMLVNQEGEGYQLGSVLQNWGMENTNPPIVSLNSPGDSVQISEPSLLVIPSNLFPEIRVVTPDNHIGTFYLNRGTNAASTLSVIDQQGHSLSGVGISQFSFDQRKVIAYVDINGEYDPVTSGEYNPVTSGEYNIIFLQPAGGNVTFFIPPVTNHSNPPTLNQ